VCSEGVAVPGDGQAGTRAEALEVTAEGVLDEQERLRVRRLGAQGELVVADDDPAAGVPDDGRPRTVAVLGERDPAAQV
jgi:hypothetical protein